MTEQIRAGAVAVNGWLAKILPSLVVAAIVGGFSAYISHSRALTTSYERHAALVHRVEKIELRNAEDRDLTARIAVLESGMARFERMLETMLFEIRQGRREVTP